MVEYLRETSYTCLEMVAVTVLGIVPSMVRTYTLMDSATDLILDYSLIKVSEVSSPVAMKKEGLRHCLDSRCHNHYFHRSLISHALQ